MQPAIEAPLAPSHAAGLRGARCCNTVQAGGRTAECIRVWKMAFVMNPREHTSQLPGACTGISKAATRPAARCFHWAQQGSDESQLPGACIGFSKGAMRPSCRVLALGSARQRRVPAAGCLRWVQQGSDAFQLPSTVVEFAAVSVHQHAFHDAHKPMHVHVPAPFVGRMASTMHNVHTRTCTMHHATCTMCTHAHAPCAKHTHAPRASATCVNPTCCSPRAMRCTPLAISHAKCAIVRRRCPVPSARQQLLSGSLQEGRKAGVRALAEQRHRPAAVRHKDGRHARRSPAACRHAPSSRGARRHVGAPAACLGGGEEGWSGGPKGGGQAKAGERGVAVSGLPGQMAVPSFL
eukprot:364358-Chlamydomonas_euryale.AAC.3